MFEKGKNSGALELCPPLEQAVCIRALAGDIVLCSWARHFYSHSASLHTGVLINWVLVSYGES